MSIICDALQFITYYIYEYPKTVLYLNDKNLYALPPDLAQKYPNVTHLYCYNNKLTELPDVLPPNLTHLYCSYNFIKNCQETYHQN